MKYTDQEWASVCSIFDQRGVSREVAEARPYKPYRRGAEWVYAQHTVPDEHAMLELGARAYRGAIRQRGPLGKFSAAWVRVQDQGPYSVIPIEQRRATVMLDVRGADGLVMFKHPVPLSERRSDFPPQLRPTPDALTGSIVNHDHRDPWIRNVSEHVEKRHPNADAWWDGVRMLDSRGGVGLGLHDNYRQEYHDHREEYRPRSLARAEHVKGRAHHKVDVTGLHPNGEAGKYKIPPTRLADSRSFHVHPRLSKRCPHRPQCESDAECTARHILKRHGVAGMFVGSKDEREANAKRGIVAVRSGFEELLPEENEPHRHTYRDKDRHSDTYGMRIDCHPWAAPRLESAEVVMFSLEGNLKADAMLTYILAHELPWSVVDVPSVGQWNAPELKDVAREHLTGRRVFLVCDSDWTDRPDVMRQAFAFRERLRELLGTERVQVAAPPESDAFEDCSDRHGNCPNPERKKIGVDDWLGSGGRIEDLEVVERQASPVMREWAESFPVRYLAPGWNPLKKTARLVTLMGLIADEDRRGKSSMKSLAAFTGMHRNTVTKALTVTWPDGSPLVKNPWPKIYGGDPPQDWDADDLEEPLERLVLHAPKMGYRDRGMYGHDIADEPLDPDRFESEQDTVEWTIREGFRWTEPKRRRKLAQLLG